MRSTWVFAWDRARQALEPTKGQVLIQFFPHLVVIGLAVLLFGQFALQTRLLSSLPVEQVPQLGATYLERTSEQIGDRLALQPAIARIVVVLVISALILALVPGRSQLRTWGGHSGPDGGYRLLECAGCHRLIDEDEHFNKQMVRIGKRTLCRVCTPFEH